MMLVLKDAKVVIGDGTTILDPATVLVDRGRIMDVVQGEVAQSLLDEAQRVIDCSGRLLIPGIINHHTHTCHYGPAQPSAAPTLSEEHVLHHLDRHLTGGSTTILNVCGFATVEDVAIAAAAHPLQVKPATSYTPANVEAANKVDGRGFKERHRGLTVEKELKTGAVAIGEIGGGYTLAGGGQEYLVIPRAVKEATGKTIEPVDARKLKEAVIGRFADPADYDKEALNRALEETGLAGDLTVEQARQLITDRVMPSLKPALAGIAEAVAEARKHNVRVIIHNAPQSMRKLLEVAETGGALMVAAHANHPNFEALEALDNARALRDRGVLIDVATIDLWGAQRLSGDPELFYEFYRQGLVDLLSTDFAGGYFDSVLTGVEQAVKAEAARLPAVIATATSRVVEAFPGLAPERGLIARDKIADVVVTDPQQISDVQFVLIGGKVVVEDGVRV
jgi:imidazolonepropionase-like amidohydrolase